MNSDKSLILRAPKMIHFPDWKMLAVMPLLAPIDCFGLIFIRDKIFGYLLIQKLLIFGDKTALIIFGDALYIAHIESNLKVGRRIFGDVKKFSKH